MKLGVVGGLVVILLSSCNQGVLVQETTEIEQGQWAFQDVRRLSVDVSDTITSYDYHLLVRHGGQYAWQNLILYFKTYRPDNTFSIDTLNCTLAQPDGTWMGKGLGDILDNRILFKINQRFRTPGTYMFEFQHAMRPDTVMEVYDIGILISEAEAR